MARLRRFLSLTILLLGSCAAGRRHTSDATLERIFKSHQAEFESLRAEMEAGPLLMRLFAGRRMNLHELNLSAMDIAGLPRERVRQYEDRLRRLGLWSVMKGGYGIEFRIDPGTISNGDSYKASGGIERANRVMSERVSTITVSRILTSLSIKPLRGIGTSIYL